MHGHDTCDVGDSSVTLKGKDKLGARLPVAHIHPRYLCWSGHVRRDDTWLEVRCSDKPSRTE
jgi:hypothetical protein